MVEIYLWEFTSEHQMVSSVDTSEQNMKLDSMTLLTHLILGREGHNKLFMDCGLPSNVKKQYKMFMLKSGNKFPKDSHSKHQTEIGKTTLLLEIFQIPTLHTLVRRTGAHLYTRCCFQAQKHPPGHRGDKQKPQ